MTSKQIEANRRNARKSTGPQTPEGQAVSKMNALKHGFRSKETVVRGRCIQEDEQEFADLHQRLWEDLKPGGVLEEMLVNQIVTTHWRLRRALKAESGEIALSVDEGQWDRSHLSPRLASIEWGTYDDPVFPMRQSALGNGFLEQQLQAVRASVEQAGELTESAVQSVTFQDKPYSLTEDLEKLRAQLQPSPDGLDEAALRARRKEQALAYLDRELRFIAWQKVKCEEHEQKEEEARLAAAVLPTPAVLDKLMRYETMLQRQLHRDMNQLERLQRRRLGAAVPPPLAVEMSGRV